MAILRHVLKRRVIPALCPDRMEMRWYVRIANGDMGLELQVRGGERSVPTFWRDTYNDRNDTAVRRVAESSIHHLDYARHLD